MRHLIFLIMTLGTLHAQDHSNQLMNQYSDYKNSSLEHRRFKQVDLIPLIEKLPSMGFRVEEVGRSYQGKPIHLISIGSGPRSALLWSQMHGDEATATMALFDIFNYLGQNQTAEVEQLLSAATLYFIPMLNPDGAELFQRRTSQGIDMNRDALSLQCPESQILKSVRDRLNADFGFNLHDQNIYYNVGATSKPATISFLAPAYNQEKQVNEKREDAMKVIAVMNEALQALIPGQVGKYDDTFEPRAFGDNIQKWGTRTILIESGGYASDPEKQFIRKLNYLAIIAALNSIASGSYKQRELKEYEDIPFNSSGLNDLIIRNVEINHSTGGTYVADIAIRREEFDTTGNEPVFYKGTIEDFGDLSTQYGYQEIAEEGLVMAEGKTYPDILQDSQAIMDLGVMKLLQEGYTDFQLKQLPTGRKNPLPFNLVASKQQYKLTVNSPANFLLLKNKLVKYLVINGYVHQLDHPLSPDAAGWINRH